MATVAGTAAPMLTPAPAVAQTAFSDVSNNYWAKDFIQDLSKTGIFRQQQYFQLFLT
ncbi:MULTISPECIES: hypothetical protein [unclassified Microcoleus]|uniref:hypothetical protein n=1 Tax=unclassified Microcoleus TaxID=2642155 RepID=UPI0025EDBDF3|nr:MULTISPECIES: hypothetical protein [unclassified Microcoleus]